METRGLEGISVLVVDDHLDSLELAELVLGRAGARVVSAPSGEAGLRFLDAYPIDVIVCDLTMPDLDGIELIERVRSRRDEKGDVPAVAVSGNATATDIGGALAAGFDVHAAKPIAPEHLVALVRQLCGRDSGRIRRRSEAKVG